MPREIEARTNASVYRQPAHVAALFETSLRNPVPPSVVAQKIVEIVDKGTWQLRHPVGPDAVPFLRWRNQMTDEEWVELNAGDDETWHRRVERDFGLKTDAKNQVA